MVKEPYSLIQSVGEVLISFISSSPHGMMNASALETGPGFHSACGTVEQPVRTALIAQSVEHCTLTREARVRLPAVAVRVVVLSKPFMHSCFGSLSRWIMD